MAHVFFPLLGLMLTAAPTQAPAKVDPPAVALKKTCDKGVAADCLTYQA